MNVHDLVECGWQRDLPDHRDLTPAHAVVRTLLRRLRSAERARPTQVDWREYCGPIDDQLDLPTSSAHACTGLIQYFERRSTGKLIRPARLFLHSNAQRLAGNGAEQGTAGLRTTFKAAVRFGLPPERFWPYEAAAMQKTPDPIAYGYDAEYRRIRYVRLDRANQSGRQTLEIVKSFLAAGFACAMGFGVPSSATDEPEIPFPTAFDAIRIGQAAVAVGYDDMLRIRSEKGAILFRNSWGVRWGDGGYGWLPYRFVTDELCADLWTILKARWLKSDEFELPS